MDTSIAFHHRAKRRAAHAIGRPLLLARSTAGIPVAASWPRSSNSPVGRALLPDILISFASRPTLLSPAPAHLALPAPAPCTIQTPGPWRTVRSGPAHPAP